MIKAKSFLPLRFLALGILISFYLHQLDYRLSSLIDYEKCSFYFRFLCSMVHSFELIIHLITFTI